MKNKKLRFWKRCYESILFISILTILPNIGATQVLPKSLAQITSVEGITEYRLDNGLKVLLFPDESKPTVLVNITYLVGSGHENYGETGMAHLLEHLLFKGSPTNPHLSQEFTKRGIRFNGTTSLDRTNFYEIFQSSDDNLKWAIDMEADRMINSFMTKKDLDSEMSVVRNEFESGENLPFKVMLKRIQSVAFDWHSYGKSTIGNRSDIENVKIQNLQAFYRTYYQPDNAVLLIAGNFHVDQALMWVAKAFGPIARPKRKLPEFWTTEPMQDGERSFNVRRKGDIQIISVAYKVPSVLHPDNTALSFASAILTSTPNGRLHKQLVETGKAIQVFSHGLSGLYPGLQTINAVVKKGDAIEPVRDALVSAIENFHHVQPTNGEMERVRRDYANQIEKILNDHQKVGLALSEAIALGDWRLLFHSRGRQENVTAEQVSAIANHYFKRDNRIVGTFLPEDQPQRVEIPSAPSAADVLKDFTVKEQVVTSETFDFSQANIEARTHQRTIGGLNVALLPKKNRGETVSVALDLHWGDENTLFGKRIIAEMTAGMLTRGTAKFSRELLVDEFAKLKVTGNIYRFETTRSHLKAALQLIAHVLKEPNFPESEFEQLRKQMLVGIEAKRSDPRTLAAQAIGQYFNQYPKGDWRAFETMDEQIAAVKATSLNDVKTFHKNFYGASRGELAIVGDFDIGAISKIIEESFGNWKSATPYVRMANNYVNVSPMRKGIDVQDKESGFYMARVNIELCDDNADYPALMVANYLFGGGAGLGSRLLERIRQKEGLSYGGGSLLDAGAIDCAGSFSISAIAAPQNLIKVDAAIKDELNHALDDGFTAEEVARAKSGILQQRVQSRSQDRNLANDWVHLLYLKRTLARSKKLEEAISALTVDQVNAAFRRAIDPTKMSIVIVGDEIKMNVAVAKP